MNNKTDLIEYLLRLRRQRPDPGPAPVPVVRQGPGAGRRAGTDERRPRPGGPGAQLAGLRRRIAGRRPRRRSTWRSAATSAPIATCCWWNNPTATYAVTILKQFLYDAWHLPVLQGLSQSSDERIAGIAAKAVKEVTYHLRRSGEWVERLGDGTEESHQRMLAAIPEVWRFTVELIAADDSEQRLCEAGITPDIASVARAVASQGQRRFSPAPPCPCRQHRAIST